MKDGDSVIKPTEPLKWFGVLAPSTLKQSQKCFEKAAELTVGIASLQSELALCLRAEKSLRKEMKKQ